MGCDFDNEPGDPIASLSDEELREIDVYGEREGYLTEGIEAARAELAQRKLSAEQLGAIDCALAKLDRADTSPRSSPLFLFLGLLLICISVAGFAGVVLASALSYVAIAIAGAACGLGVASIVNYLSSSSEPRVEPNESTPNYTRVRAAMFFAILAVILAVAFAGVMFGFAYVYRAW